MDAGAATCVQPAQPPNIPDPSTVCIPVHSSVNDVDFLRIPADFFVQWADSHTKWDDAHRFGAWREVFYADSTWGAYIARKRAVFALSSTVANTSAHVLRLLVQGAASTRSIVHATCAVEAVLGSDDILAVSALRLASQDSVAVVDVAAMQRARRAIHEPNAVFNVTGWTRGTCASGVACAVRTKKAAVRVVRLLTGGEPCSEYTSAWCTLTSSTLRSDVAVSSAQPAGEQGTNPMDVWIQAWRDIMCGSSDAAAQHAAWCVLMSTVLQDCFDDASHNGAVTCVLDAMRQGAWPLGPDNPSTPKGVPVPTRAHSNDVHCPALAMLLVCLESDDVDRMWAASVWYAAWGYHLIPMLTLMTQLYRVATSPPIPPAARTPHQALYAPFPVAGPMHTHDTSALTTPLTRPKDNDGALEYCEALLFQHAPKPMQPAWWWHADVPISCTLSTAHTASAKLIRSWYRGTHAKDSGTASCASVDNCLPTAIVPVPQQHAFAMSGTVGVVWRAMAWTHARKSTDRATPCSADMRALLGMLPSTKTQLQVVSVTACPVDWMRRGAASDAPCVPWSNASPKCPESLQRGMHATLDKLRELPEGTPTNAVLHKPNRTRDTLHKWVMYHAEKARLRGGIAGNRTSTRALEWVCPSAVPLVLPWPLHLSRTGVQNAQDVDLLQRTAKDIAVSHGAAHPPFVQRSTEVITSLCKRGIRRAAAAASPADSVVYVLQGGHLVHTVHAGMHASLSSKARPLSAYVIGPVSDEAVLLEAVARGLIQAGGLGCPEWDAMQVLHTPYGVYTAFLRGAAYTAHEFTELTCPHAAARTRAALRRVRAVAGMRRAVARMVQTAVHRGHVHGTDRPETLLHAAVAMGRTSDSTMYCAGGVWVWGTAAAYPHLHDTHAEWTREAVAASVKDGYLGTDRTLDTGCAAVPPSRFAVSKAKYDNFASRAAAVLALVGLQDMVEHITESYKHLVCCA